MQQEKLKVGILGATGMVGQRFISLLKDHPWFEVAALGASSRSSGKTYHEAVDGRWMMNESIPENVWDLTVQEVSQDLRSIASQVDFVFSALEMEKDEIRSLEERYAEEDVPVVSNNSAHRWTADVPMIMPEINADHLDIIKDQQKARGWERGFIVVKPNCSLQSYVPVIEAFREFGPERVLVSTYQAISGAGKNFETFPEIHDNIIPLISGEEDKSELEPMKIFGSIDEGKIISAVEPIISTTCVRVPVLDGHLASVSISFAKEVEKDQLIHAIQDFRDPLSDFDLPSKPVPFITYFEEDDHPQTRLDRNLGRGMGISVGRLREDAVLGWKFVCLSHNTIRGAAGGAVLIAELLREKGYFVR